MIDWDKLWSRILDVVWTVAGIAFGIFCALMIFYFYIQFLDCL